MSAAADPLDALEPERKLSGATLLVLAFVTGTLFALLPMYYLYTTRASGGSAAVAPLASAPATPVVNDAPVRATAAGTASARFAARMTYELSHTPAEPPPAKVLAVAKAEPVVPRAAPVAAPPPAPVRPEPAPRVANARPIIATPPDARDTTREMEREARRPDYREPPRQIAQVTVETPPTQPKVIEGREFVLPPKVATKPIAGAAEDSAKRAVATANGRTTVATAAVVQGVSPIAAPPEAKAATDAPKAKAETASDMLASRLSATREWLAGAAQTTHTIQLMGSGSEEHMRNQLKALGKVLEPGKIYVIRTVAQGKPAMTVLYGAYPDKAAAVQALEKLPPAVAANKPVLRTVNGLRAEQKQHGTS